MVQEALCRAAHCFAIRHVRTLAESAFNANALRVSLTLSRKLAATLFAGLIDISEEPT
jgi:hypothetical protein